MPKTNTSWGKEAEWYGKVLADEDSYQQKVILPNLLRLMEIKKGENILDIGCGTGFFSKAFVAAGAKVVGVDLGKELIEMAEKNVPEAKFVVASAEDLKNIPTSSVDKATMVLSLQNMANASAAISELSRVLKTGGRGYIVLNHPAFRIPGETSWGWDPKGIQYRRTDSYLSEKKIKIEMHPGSNPSENTWSFHAPLQYYFKFFSKNGLLVERLEEWVSHRKTEAGPRKNAEDKARNEFPLFLALVLVKNG